MVEIKPYEAQELPAALGDVDRHQVLEVRLVAGVKIGSEIVHSCKHLVRP